MDTLSGQAAFFSYWASVHYKKLEVFAREAAKNIKAEKDLCDFSQMLMKITVETALSATLDNHLGYGKHRSSSAGNSRNGYSSKALITQADSFEVDIPRDRAADFEPKLVKKTPNPVFDSG
ncbi:MAG TPA: hypothetical protein EYQ14_25885 [Gammaproteobacteria bacterium]|nr:hypothetical protein [Gammaproteobacteria bacterium]